MAEDDRPGLTLEQYAALCVGLRSAPSDERDAYLRKRGFSLEVWERARAYWSAALEKDAEVGDGELLVAWAAACDAPVTLPEVAAAEPVAAGAGSVGQPPAAEAAPEVAKAMPSFLLSRQPAPPKTLGEMRSGWQASRGIGGHGPSALDPPPIATPALVAPAPVVRGAIAPAPPPPVAVPPPAMVGEAISERWHEGETCITDDVGTMVRALPFDGSARAPAPATPFVPPAAPPPSSEEEPSFELPNDPEDDVPDEDEGGGTLVIAPGAAHGNAAGVDMPFDSRRAADQAGAPQSGAGVRAEAPPSAPRSSSTPMSIEQYAALHAELQAFPSASAQIRARHGFADDAAWSRFSGSWGERLRQDRDLYKRFYDLFLRYRAWFVQRSAD